MIDVDLTTVHVLGYIHCHSHTPNYPQVNIAPPPPFTYDTPTYSNTTLLVEHTMDESSYFIN